MECIEFCNVYLNREVVQNSETEFNILIIQKEGIIKLRFYSISWLNSCPNDSASCYKFSACEKANFSYGEHRAKKYEYKIIQ